VCERVRERERERERERGERERERLHLSCPDEADQMVHHHVDAELSADLEQERRKWIAIRRSGCQPKHACPAWEL
jgi:hypothetical protein